MKKQKLNVRKEGKLDTPWDYWYNVPLIRNSPRTDDKPYTLEPGVIYFVAKLETLGLKTCWSCEGHPTEFYMVFKAPFRKAAEIAYASAGIADVAITRGYRKWDNKKNEIYYYKQPWWRMSLYSHLNTYEARNHLLRDLSIQWEEQL